ncbi:hypothetical protein MPTK1_2g08490 [Marchantia polymorpha subsp. ruderalis]|uniref:Uncharacterized protein n=1 Tax=Marchantia polymorpha TaxID=3197 RepID=A0A2R6XGZ5_MARPO|nr:hypothetical protein MARPO_0015s0134 [Marchantia polymorpha]BBN01573.1 hypothetical protein Mp_2g08490 [Marchantia polymorpha subsp. ruderalis]|eukprot:PTQ45339.1 hypothetical protein MARPO_0015s0134 [Marchantia polymorpha]
MKQALNLEVQVRGCSAQNPQCSLNVVDNRVLGCKNVLLYSLLDKVINLKIFKLVARVLSAYYVTSFVAADKIRLPMLKSAQQTSGFLLSAFEFHGSKSDSFYISVNSQVTAPQISEWIQCEQNMSDYSPVTLTRVANSEETSALVLTCVRRWGRLDRRRRGFYNNGRRRRLRWRRGRFHDDGRRGGLRCRWVTIGNLSRGRLRLARFAALVAHRHALLVVIVVLIFASVVSIFPTAVASSLAIFTAVSAISFVATAAILAATAPVLPRLAIATRSSAVASQGLKLELVIFMPLSLDRSPHLQSENAHQSYHHQSLAFEGSHIYESSYTLCESCG